MSHMLAPSVSYIKKLSRVFWSRGFAHLHYNTRKVTTRCGADALPLVAQAWPQLKDLFRRDNNIKSKQAFDIDEVECHKDTSCF